MYKYLLLALITTTSYGAADAISHHSRAKCYGFYESISWDGSKPHYLKAQSDHYSNGQMMHSAGLHLVYGKRAASYHVGNVLDLHHEIDAVQGYHGISEDGINWSEYSTYATDCNIYNGWWEFPGLEDIFTPPPQDIPIPNNGNNDIPNPSGGDDSGLGSNVDTDKVVQLIITVVKIIWSWIFG